MAIKNQLNYESNFINLNKKSKNYIQNQKLKNELCFNYKDKILRKIYLKKKTNSKFRFIKFQIINKKLLNKEVEKNFSFENYILKRQKKSNHQTKHKNIICKQLKFKIIGGGCSQSQVRILNPNRIYLNPKKINLNEEFMQRFQMFSDKKNIVQNIKSEIQEESQMDIIKCLKDHEVRIRRNMIYKPKVIQLLDVYLIYVLTGSNQNEDQIRKIGSQLQELKESFEVESRDNPICDLIFYFDILEKLNSIQISKDEQNKKILTHVANLITTTFQFGLGMLKTLEGNFMKDIGLFLKDVRILVDSYQSQKSIKLFFSLLEIWGKKTEKFKDKIWTLNYLEQLEFYMAIFNNLFSQDKDETDLVIVALINIDHYFCLALEDENNLKYLRNQLFLYSDQIKIFVEFLIQKNESLSFLNYTKLLLKFSIQNHTYRFLTIQILLKYNKLIQDINYSKDYKSQIMEFLCYKYLCEKDKQVKIAFQTSIEFTDHFNSNIDNLKEKIISLSYERKKIFNMVNLQKFEDTIQNIQDIQSLKTNIIIEKQERDIKRRQQDNIAQKDQFLLEVQDLYIEQSITYLAGNSLFQPKQLLSQNNEKNQLPYQKSNALQEILHNFLQINTNTQLNQNVNITRTQEQNRCQILGILAEGGTGKSMLIKKLETYLIQTVNSISENEHYMPFLIKCNSLDPNNPSIENYLFAQGINEKQINSLKKSNRNKLILLDGYDEFTGGYFRVYSQLNLRNWINTKVIVTSRKEKLELSDACNKFSLDGDNGQRDNISFCIVKLEEFSNINILQYYQMYFKQYRTKEEIFDEIQYNNDLYAMEDCMKSPSLESLLYLPINLYLFTRMIVLIKDKNEIQKIKENVFDQIEIQEIFFHEQFKREDQDFIQLSKESSQRDSDFNQLIVNSFFEYFQSISIKMFQNKGKSEIANFLQIQREKVQFKLSKQVENKLSEQEKELLSVKIFHYVNSQIITRLKEDIQYNIINTMENKSQFIEFKHKSLFEYFVARAMKYDFDIHEDNIYKLTIEQLREFNINKKCIMNGGQNQSEQQILIKLYKMLLKQIESSNFYENYHLEQIEKNSRYIQYIKRSTIKNNRETSQIDIGASNILSVLFFSKYTYSQLQLNFCSFSKLYVSRQKSNLISFDNCNLQYSYLKKLYINYDSCNTTFATFDSFQKEFDTSNIFSLNQAIWYKSNILYSITKSGFINAFKIVNQNIELQKSKQLSQTSLNQICIVDNDTLLVSTQYSLLLINSNSFDLLQSYKFKNGISSIILIKENILVTVKNGTVFYGSFQNGFRNMNMIGFGSAYNESKQILLVYSIGDFSLYDINENFEFIKKIQGHSKTISSVAFSADGKYLATGSDDKTCKIWNAEKGFELIKTIQFNTNSISSVTFSADGKYLATGSDDKTCRIWDAEKVFELINTIQGHTKTISSVAFSEDGKYLATGSDDKTCRIWNAEKGFKLINKIKGHTKTITSVAFSADGKYFATGSDDKTCIIWNAEKGFELINTIQGHTKTISSVAFSADGKYLATCSQDETYKIWNAEKGFELINTIEGYNNITSVAFSADGKYFATGSDDKNCRIWNAEKSFELINTIQGHTKTIYSVAFSADGKYLATGSDDKTCKIWNAEKGFELINTIQGHNDTILSVAFSEDGKYLATGSSDYDCKMWNAEKGFELICTISGHTDSIGSIAFSADGKYLATGSDDLTCKIWNTEQGFELINTIQDHTGIIRSVAFSADGKYLATGSEDLTCKIWTVEKHFEVINTAQGHSDNINSVAFSADGKYLVTGSSDKTCKIWNTEKNFELFYTIQGHASRIYSAAFSVDGRYLVTGSQDQTFKVWNAERGFELINTVEFQFDAVISVTFSADGKYLETGSLDHTCKIWNAEKGFKLINTIQGHTGSIRSVSFSADGKYLATGSLDHTCKIWNAEKGFELTNTIQGHTNSIRSVSFSADGKYLATGSDDTTCKIWNVEKGFEHINTIKGHTNPICSVAFSADGKYLSTGSEDNTCKIWDGEKGFKLISTFYDHIGSISSISFSADGKYFATGSFDRTCKIYNTQVGFQLIKRDESHVNLISSIGLSADGKYLASSSLDNTCKIYNIDEGIDLIKKIENNPEHITSVVFYKEGKCLASSSDKACNLWNTKEDFNLIDKIESHTQQISSIAFSSDGKYLATGSYDKTCNIWNWNVNKNCFELFKKIIDHTHYVSSIAFSVDGKYLATGSSDKTCKIWKAQNNFELVKEASISHTHYISCIAFSEDGKYLATGSWDKTCKIWDAKNKFKQIKTIKNKNVEQIFSVSFSQDSYYLSICSMNSVCTLWLINDFQNEPILILNNVNKFQFSVGNQFIYVEQLDEFYKVFIIKDFYPINKQNYKQLQQITQSYQKDQQNEMIYLKYSTLFKNIIEL